MKNWKLNLLGMEIGVFKNYKDFDSNQKNKLKELGFVYKSTFRQYTLYMGNFIEMVLDMNKEAMYFYSSRYMLPCELRDEVVIDKSKKLASVLHKEGIIK